MIDAGLVIGLISAAHTCALVGLFYWVTHLRARLSRAEAELRQTRPRRQAANLRQPPAPAFLLAQDLIIRIAGERIETGMQTTIHPDTNMIMMRRGNEQPAGIAIEPLMKGDVCEIDMRTGRTRLRRDSSE